MTPNSEPDRDFPWWLVILAVTGLWLLYEMLSDEVYAGALRILSKGLWVTLAVAVVAYLGACAIGLGLAVMGLSRFLLLRQIARLPAHRPLHGLPHRRAPAGGLRPRFRPARCCR